MTLFLGIDGGSFMTGLLLGFTLCVFALVAVARFWPEMGAENE